MADAGAVRAWSMYSWANHGWETTVATVLIGPWLLSLATDHHARSANILSVAGLHLHAEAYPSFVLTVAALVKLVLLPPLGASAQPWATRRRLLVVSCVIGSAGAVSLAATTGGDYIAAGLIFGVGAIAFGASNVFYNSYLPGIAASRDRDAVSSRGFIFGYVGGGLLLAANLLLIQERHAIGLDKATAVRICFASAGVWWLVFGLASVTGFAGRRPDHEPAPTAAWQQLRRTLRSLRTRRHTARYLVAYLLFSDAISAVIALSSTFLTHQLFGDSTTRAATFLFELILLIQFVAAGGAALFARYAARAGAKRALLSSLGIWCAIVVYSYLFVGSKIQAVIVGIAIGLVLGGSQALARSLWSQMVPPGEEAAHFGLYEVANEGTAWIAPLLFTIVVNITGSFREAILSLLVLFVAGAALLARADVDVAAGEAAKA